MLQWACGLHEQANPEDFEEDNLGVVATCGARRNGCEGPRQAPSARFLFRGNGGDDLGFLQPHCNRDITEKY